MKKTLRTAILAIAAAESGKRAIDIVGEATTSAHWAFVGTLALLGLVCVWYMLRDDWPKRWIWSR